MKTMVPVAVILTIFGCAEIAVPTSNLLSSSLAATSGTSPAVLHLVNRWNCRRTRAQLGLGGPWATGQFHPNIPCRDSCSGRYGIPDTLKGEPVRWELSSGASPHSRGALLLLETLLNHPSDPLLSNGQIEHQGSDALAEQDLALLHCGQTPVYTWLANRLAVALGGRSAIVSHREGGTLALDDLLIAAGCEPCEWTLTIRRTVEPISPWDSGQRRHRLHHQGAAWDLDLPPEWVGADAVVQVVPAGDPRRGSAPINLKLVAETGDREPDNGNGGPLPEPLPEPTPTEPLPPEPTPDPDACKESLDELLRAAEQARAACVRSVI